MGDPVDALILDLLDMLAGGPRPYAEVMDAWRTSCPRLPVWEDATERGLVTRAHSDAMGSVVELTAAGRAHLAAHRARDRR
jgi:D-3-phosphoglycerate dehydrogenase